MRFFGSSTRWVGLACTIAVLAACNGGSQTPLNAVPGAQTAMHGQSHWNVSPVSVPKLMDAIGAPDRGQSWMHKTTMRRPALMYVTNWLHGTVSVYNYRNGQNITLFGKLTGFKTPGQPCVDRSGNVYIPDPIRQTLTKFAWGQVHPIAVLADPYGGPTSCSVDRTTGNVAAANFGFGNVAIWAGGTGTPTQITYPTSAYTEFVGYDDTGDLLLASNNGSGSGILAYLPAGATSFTDLTQNGFTVGFPGNVQWGGTYWLVGDQGTEGVGCPCHVTQVGVSGSNASLDGSVLTFGGTTVDIIGFWKRGSPHYAHISAADFGQSKDIVYSFPAMSPVTVVSQRVKIPFGVAVSQQPPSP